MSPAEELSPEDRLSRLEQNVEEMKGMLTKLCADAESEEEGMPMEERMKQDEEEDEDKKKQDEEEPEEEDKKKEDSEEEPAEEDKQKQDSPETIDNDEDVKLPQADAGETDETAPPEGGSEEFLEKRMKKVVKDVFKEMGFTKASTPRTEKFDVKKSQKPSEPAMDLMKKAKEGKLDQAGMTREIKKMQTANRDAGLREVLERD